MKIEIKDEIIEIAPFLVAIGNKTPFVTPPMYFENLDLDMSDLNPSVPEDYFNQLTDKVISKAKTENRTKVIGLNVRKWIAAASIIGLSLVAYITMSSGEQSNINESYATDIELEEVLEYLIENDEINISEAMDLSQIEIFEDIESDDIIEDDFDLILDEVTLEELDALL